MSEEWFLIATTFFNDECELRCYGVSFVYKQVVFSTFLDKRFICKLRIQVIEPVLSAIFVINNVNMVGRVQIS